VRIKNYKNTASELLTLDAVPKMQKAPSKIIHNDKYVERSITYEKVIDEIMELGYHTDMTLEYRLLEGENINELLLSIINKNSETKSTVGYHTSTLKCYLDEDLLERFI